MPTRWFPGLRDAARGALGGVESKGIAERVRSQFSNYTVTGTPYPVDWSVDRAVREGFRANPWIFRSVEVIAYTSLQRQITMRRGDPDDGDKITIGADPTRVLYRLNRRANKWEPAALFRYRLIAQFLLSSRGVFVEVNRSRNGAIAMLTLLDPDLVDMVPTTDDPIGAFIVRTTGDTGGRRDPLPPFDPGADPGEQPSSVLWIRSPHPTVLTQGMSPMEAAGLSVDLDRYARMYNRDYMQSGGRPGGILGVKGSIDPATITALERHFNHNARPGETTAINADAMFYQDLSTSPRDVQWGDIMDRMRKEASIVFGVPESMMGDASGRTFDNADAEYAIFMEHRFAPLVKLVDDQLDALTGEDDDDLWLRHDLDDVWVLKRHRRADEERMAADLDRGAITMNEYRKFRGLDPIDAPWARVCWVMGGKAAGWVEDEGDAAAAAAAPMIGSPPPGDSGGTPGEPGPQFGNAPNPAELASFNAQTNANAANLRGVAADGQGRSPGGGAGQLQLAHLAPRQLEGKQGRARDRDDDPDDPDDGPSPGASWR